MPCGVRERLCVFLNYEVQKIEAREGYRGELEWVEIIHAEFRQDINSVGSMLLRNNMNRHQAQLPGWGARVDELVRLTMEEPPLTVDKRKENADWRRAVMDCIKGMDTQLKDAYFANTGSYCGLCIHCKGMVPCPVWGSEAFPRGLEL